MFRNVTVTENVKRTMIHNVIHGNVLQSNRQPTRRQPNEKRNITGTALVHQHTRTQTLFQSFQRKIDAMRAEASTTEQDAIALLRERETLATEKELFRLTAELRREEATLEHDFKRQLEVGLFCFFLQRIRPQLIGTRDHEIV